MVHQERTSDILHVGWGHPPATGGGPIFYVHNLCRQQLDKGYRPSCFVAGMTPPAPEKEPRLSTSVVDGIPYDIVNDRPIHYYDWSQPAREVRHAGIESLFIQALRTREPEIVHFHNLVGLSMSLIQTAKRYGAATLFSVHNYWMICPRDDLFAPNEESCSGPGDGARCASCVGQPHRVVAFMDRFSQARDALENHTDHILAVSTRVKEILVQNGIAEEKITVNHIGSTAAENNWKHLGKARLQNPKVTWPVRFAYFGVMAPRKGAHVIVEAAGRMETHAGRFLVELHGWNQPGPFMARLEHMFSRKPFLKEVVQFKGKYTQGEQPELLRDVHAAIIPPVWEDNGPQTVMETLGAGAPVIGARIGGIPDFVHQGKNGRLFRAGDAQELSDIMKEMVDHPKNLEELTRGITPPLSMEQHVMELENVYKELGEILSKRRMGFKKAEVWIRIAQDARKRGRMAEAEDAFRKSIEVAPQSAEARYQYAQLLEHLDRPREAVSQLRDALSLNPDHVSAQNDLGVHCYKMGQTEEALQHLAIAYTLDKHNTQPLENMAAIYLETEQEGKALEIYQQLLSEHPDDPELLNLLGIACSRMDRFEDAGFFWSRVLELAPAHEEARQHLERLKRLHEDQWEGGSR